MAKKLTIALATIFLAGFALAACGGDDDESSTTAAESTTETTETSGGSSGGGGTVSFEADPSGALAFTETEVSASAGENTVEFDNQSSTAHDVVIEGDGEDIAETEVITGSTTSTTAELEPGTYTFYCSVDSHREAGMEGTLTVK
jgi:plastocyanin